VPEDAEHPGAIKMDKIPRPEIAIVGLGYVGLLLSLQFARSGVAVPGLDIDSDKVMHLIEGAVKLSTFQRKKFAEQVKTHRRAIESWSCSSNAEQRLPITIRTSQ
jgi:UDP-N-acetyl-D-mannosaminuronate dehydrogenase